MSRYEYEMAPVVTKASHQGDETPQILRHLAKRSVRLGRRA